MPARATRRGTTLHDAGAPDGVSRDGLPPPTSSGGGLVESNETPADNLTALPVDDAPASLLSPLMSNLPSISGISEMAGVGALKSFLPMGSPSPLAEAPPLGDDTSAVWRDANLGGGKSRVLMLTSPTHALQVFAFTDGVIPDDPHVQESFPAPIELASVPRIEYEQDAERTAVPGAKVATDAGLVEHVLAVDLLNTCMSAGQGPSVALTCRSADGRLAAVLVSLRTGKAFRRLDLGKGQAASVICSPRAIVITASHPTPCIYVVNGKLETTHSLITDLPADATTLLPVIALSGRLLAYATDEPAATPGPHGLGSIATARTTRPRVASAGADTTAPHTGAQTAQGAFRSAVEIGGGVARGVWAGIKMGAKAAQAAQAQANSGRLAQSAPNDRFIDDHLGSPGSTVESRSVEDGLAPSDQLAKPPAGVWVKILDLGGQDRVVAHFRLPPQRHLVPSMPPQSPRGGAVARDHPVSLLSFSPDGTRLFVAPADGRAFHILELRPRGATQTKPGVPRGEVWEAYVLRRGNTTARVRTVAWTHDERYIAVGTGRGTIHVFAICPGGGQPSAASHVPLKLGNAHLLPPLSVNVTPCARVRPYRDASSDNLAADKAEAEARSSYAMPTFTAVRPHPLAKDILCQDVAIYRPQNGELDLARLGVHKTAPAAELSPPTARRGSNLTEMMRQRAGLRSDNDLEAEAVVKARWALPLGRGDADDVETVASPKTVDTSPPALKNLHHAEIRTHTTNPRVLPASIYLSHQVEFYAAVPTDEYSPLSVLDKVARTRRLVFRPEVEVVPSTEARSFDEPLSSALHSMMDSRPSTQVPRLPNGSPIKGGLWGSIPIRQVAVNLGEGVDRVRREYARAQHRRSRARSNAGTGGTPLSFEDDTVFATLDDGEGDVASASSAPSSGPLPPTVNGGDADLDEWNDRWEDEYRAAVEDDGGAEDLVLGLLDEEEEERRRWEARQTQLKKQYQ